jgi:hypothetical protein
MLGGLPVEMAGVMGDVWCAVMTTANVTTERRTDNLEKGHDTSRSQWTHQVTAASLFHLMKQAYAAYQQVTDVVDERLSFKEWHKQMEDKHPQFSYWSKTLDLELLFLQFLWSQCDANITLYVEAIVPWMFAIDHLHYARWLSVHTCDLQQLNIT